MLFSRVKFLFQRTHLGLRCKIFGTNSTGNVALLRLQILRRFRQFRLRGYHFRVLRAVPLGQLRHLLLRLGLHLTKLLHSRSFEYRRYTFD